MRLSDEERQALRDALAYRLDNERPAVLASARGPAVWGAGVARARRLSADLWHRLRVED